MPESLDTLSFEDAMAELEAIVRRMEAGEGSLEQSITDYTRGTALKKHCDAKLKDAQLKVQKLVADDAEPDDASAVRTEDFALNSY